MLLLRPGRKMEALLGYVWGQEMWLEIPRVQGTTKYNGDALGRCYAMSDMLWAQEIWLEHLNADVIETSRVQEQRSLRRRHMWGDINDVLRPGHEMRALLR